jgi:glutamate-ammonia-ligase adenylyltransferase
VGKEGRPRSSRPWLGQGQSTFAAGARDAFLRAGGDPADAEAIRLVETLGEHAPALLHLALRDPSLPRDVLREPLTHVIDGETLRARVRRSVAEAAKANPGVAGPGTAGGPGTASLDHALRAARHRGVVRIALRETLRLADIDQTSQEIAELAGAIVDAALDGVSEEMARAHGRPLSANGTVVPFTVLGMGKLGGRELNIGSDIDLCYFYETDDGAPEDQNLTLHAYFTKLATRLTRALSDVTEDGACFRVDLRLRPEGTQGPVVNSLASTERYYETWGRTWERAVLLRAAPIAGDRDFGHTLLGALKPFVFRRDVSPRIGQEMAALLVRSRRELRIDPVLDVKLGPGGIREAEFFVQILQLVWGGRHPELQLPGTVEALRRLRALGYVTDQEMAVLETDWALLRRIEHRIHVRVGYQTHSIPPEGTEREQLAVSLGFLDAAELMSELAATRGRITALFRSVAGDGPGENDPFVALADELASDARTEDLLAHAKDVLGLHADDAALAHLGRLRRRPDAPFGGLTRTREPDLGPQLLREIRGAASADLALQYTAEFFARSGDVSGFGVLLRESPLLLRRLVALFGASPTLSEALVQHPESIGQTLVSGTPGLAEIESVHAALPKEDVEEFVRVIRRAKREFTLRAGMGFIAEDAAAELLLTSLAEAQVRACLAFAEAECERRFGRPAREDSADSVGLAVVGMGSLAAGEFTFGSDLDLLFIFESEGNTRGTERSVTNGEFFTRVAQRTMHLLSQPSDEGSGYETDARLRPDGSQGTLVVSEAAFERYHQKAAHGWERQALLRARPVAGKPTACASTAALIARLLDAPGPLDPARVAEMRARMQQERSGERPGRYHPKLGFGAIADVDFLVQFLILAHPETPSLRTASTLDGLSRLADAGIVGSIQAATLYDAHQFFRRVEQALRLSRSGGDHVLLGGTRDAERVARQLRIRDRGGETEGEALVRAWREHAYEVRALFDRLVAPVNAPPAWG